VQICWSSRKTSARSSHHDDGVELDLHVNRHDEREQVNVIQTVQHELVIRPRNTGRSRLGTARSLSVTHTADI